MNRTTFLSALVCFTASAAFADQVVLKNGDRITGAIIKKDGNSLTVKAEQIGVVTAPWDQVVSVQSDKPLNVVGAGGQTVQGSLSTNNGNLVVANLSLALAQVTSIRDDDEQKAYERLQNPGWGQLWAGTGSVGFAGTSGNAKTATFTTGINLARVTKTDSTSVYFNTIKASALVNGTSAATAQAVRGGLGYNRNLTPRVFLNVFNDWEYDRFQNLDLRVVFGGGLGFHAIKTDRHVLDLLGGAAYNHSKFSTPFTRNSAELYWGNNYSLKLNAATSLVQSFRMFNDLTHTGTIRSNFDIGASTKLSKWLTWNVSVSDRYLSKPAPGRKTNDILYTTGLGITFGR